MEKQQKDRLEKNPNNVRRRVPSVVVKKKKHRQRDIPARGKDFIRRLTEAFCGVLKLEKGNCDM